MTLPALLPDNVLSEFDGSCRQFYRRNAGNSQGRANAVAAIKRIIGVEMYFKHRAEIDGELLAIERRIRDQIETGETNG